MSIVEKSAYLRRSDEDPYHVHKFDDYDTFDRSLTS
jgi:hypothetical protein